MDDYKSRRKGGRRLLLLSAVFLCTILLLVFAGRRMEQAVQEEQEELLRRAINQAVVSCYAVEGRYPESLEYLEENYGIRIDREEYITTYEIFQDNIKPQIRVKRIGE